MESTRAKRNEQVGYLYRLIQINGPLTFAQLKVITGFDDTRLMGAIASAKVRKEVLAEEVENVNSTRRKSCYRYHCNPDWVIYKAARDEKTRRAVGKAVKYLEGLGYTVTAPSARTDVI